MSQIYEPYIAVLVVVILVVGMAAAILIINRALGPRRPTNVKGIPYESGCDPIDSARRRFSVKFYMTAILFLIFDLEVVFIFPWASRYQAFLEDDTMAGVSLFGMLLFVIVLAIGLLYEWRRGAMEWE